MAQITPPKDGTTTGDTPALQRNPGDEDAPGTPQTAENVCPHCAGKGTHADGSACPVCGGTGKVTEIVGDA